MGLRPAVDTARAVPGSENLISELTTPCLPSGGRGDVLTERRRHGTGAPIPVPMRLESAADRSGNLLLGGCGATLQGGAEQGVRQVRHRAVALGEVGHGATARLVAGVEPVS